MSHIALRCTLPLAMGFVLASAILSVGAEQTGRAYRATPDGTGALTQEMIENCISRKGELDQSIAELKSLEAQYAAAAKEAGALQAYFEALKAEKKFDPSDSKELAAYNDRIATYNAKVAEEKSLHDLMQAKKAVYDQQIATFDRACKGQPYYDDDYAAAVKKIGRGM